MGMGIDVYIIMYTIMGINSYIIMACFIIFYDKLQILLGIIMGLKQYKTTMWQTFYLSIYLSLYISRRRRHTSMLPQADLMYSYVFYIT